jgi:hypothetical protein
MGNPSFNIQKTWGEISKRKEYVTLRIDTVGGSIAFVDYEVDDAKRSLSKEGLNGIQRLLGLGYTFHPEYGYCYNQNLIDQVSQLVWAYSTFPQRESQPTQ